jgi:hypothetical protein
METMFTFISIIIIVETTDVNKIESNRRWYSLADVLVNA